MQDDRKAVWSIPYVSVAFFRVDMGVMAIKKHATFPKAPKTGASLSYAVSNYPSSRADSMDFPDSLPPSVPIIYRSR